MSKKLQIIQLSDIHIDSSTHYSLPRLEKIVESVSTIVNTENELLIIVSGDITFGGTKSEFDVAEAALKKIVTELLAKKGVVARVITVPGNHDGTFKTANKNRSYVIAGVLRDGEVGVDDSVIEACVAPMQAYFEFKETIEVGLAPVFSDSLLSIYEVEISGKIFSFWAFNVSWMSKVPEEQGKLVFPIKGYQAHLQRPATFRIGILHHPLNWYAQESYHALRDFILPNFCVLISGHEHVSGGNVSTPLSNLSSSLILLESGALGPHRKTDESSISVLEINPETSQLSQRHLFWNETETAFLEDLTRSVVIPIELRSARKFEPLDDCKEKLEELSAPFSHPARERLRLSDVYIEPQFKPPFDSPEESQLVPGRSLVMPNKCGRLLVHGDDHAGKSSFLNHTYLTSLESGFVPLLVPIRDFTSGTEESRVRKLLDLVRTQYGEVAVEAFQATPTSKRLFLVDDLDRLHANEDNYVRSLTFIARQSDNCILTVSERFDASVLGSEKISELLAEYAEYHFAGFSYVMRTELIERWYGLDRTLDRETFNKKVHEAQTHLDTAVGRALLPSTAFNTLMILQALEATQRSQVIDAGIAQHYDLLIRRRLLDASVQPKQLDGIYAYLSQLAWWMRGRDSIELDRGDLDSFNNWFSNAIHPTDSTLQVELLVKARILSLVDGVFRFRYPSARYFFLAHYIAEHIDEAPALRSMIEHACRHLYIRDNANLIVFLANKASSKWIVKEVANVLASLLGHLTPLNVVRDSQKLNSWVTKTARIAIDAEADTKKNQRDQRTIEERAAATEVDSEQTEEVGDVSELDVFSQLNLVFKTSEILGLILKSKYGSLEANLKAELISQLVDGPLRAVALFLQIVNAQPEALTAALARMWQDKLPNLNDEQRQKLAQKFIFQSVGAYSLAMLVRQGAIIGSPDLVPSFKLLQQNIKDRELKDPALAGTELTSRLVIVSTRLSYPGDIPFGEIERLAKELKNNPFGFNLLQGLTANHLYMFPVKYDVRQRLAEAVGIDIKKQTLKDALSQDEKVTRKDYKQRNSRSLIQRLAQSYLLRNSKIMELISKKKDSDEPEN